LRTAVLENFDLAAGRNGASTLHLAKLSFNIAYPECERRFAVCYTLPPIRTDFEAAQNSKQLSAVHVLDHCLSGPGSQLFMSNNTSEMLGL
jgi:hypothetical protein